MIDSSDNEAEKESIDDDRFCRRNRCNWRERTADFLISNWMTID